MRRRTRLEIRRELRIYAKHIQAVNRSGLQKRWKEYFDVVGFPGCGAAAEEVRIFFNASALEVAH
jgi:hypothetical protein